MYLDLSTRKRAGLQKNQNSSDMKQTLIKSDLQPEPVSTRQEDDNCLWSPLPEQR